MLDTGTKRRIDTARDILVGKVPDPKSQVEQITIALIYKFMDDMDAESEELGGRRKFFAAEFARYGWAKLMHSGLGGFETLNLYAEAIAKMPENPGIPPLFRDIFKNAYLPYRDPETLRAFLKVIDEFNYDHSERLGDAFEYLLSVLGSQGDAGQFRTPRHIIDFMVDIVDPKKTDTVLDPACGTAGFLISSYKHILRANTDTDGNSALTPAEKANLAQNFTGYDISPDMVRLSLVNMYLHGFADPHIAEYDTLTSLDRWNEYADVILANPPFMSPKGGIRPHNRFSVQSTRSEVLFVDYMAEHLKPAGRAGIIVPEGVVFQSQTAYKRLRKLLVDEYLVAVISLPAGVFNPYSGVKTCILILDKSVAKKASTIAFFRVENDGFGLGAQRREIGKNDLPRVQGEIGEYLNRLRAGDSAGDFQPAMGQIVEKMRIAANDYQLGADRYRESGEIRTTYALVPAKRFLRHGVQTLDPRTAPDELFELWSIPAYDAGRPELVRGSDIGSSKKCVAPRDVLLSRIIPHIRRAWVVCGNRDGRRQLGSTEWIVFAGEGAEPEFLRRILLSDPFHARFMRTISGVGGSLQRANPEAVGDIEIPLPPPDVQIRIVAEIEGNQKVIDGARSVLENYRPHIPVDPDWPVVELGDICSFKNGLNFTRSSSGHPVKMIGVGDFQSNLYAPLVGLAEVQLDAPVPDENLVAEGDILFVRSNGNPDLVGRSMIVPTPSEPTAFSGFVIRARFQHEGVSPLFYANLFKSRDFAEMIKTVGLGANIRNLSQQILNRIRVPLPPLATQQAIVAEMEADQSLVAGNRELIRRFEKKIEATLARVWGEGESDEAGL
jgi:type I restriction enzyme M protein